MDYYNTNRESGNTLSDSRLIAKEQQTRILDYFRANEDKSYTPCEVWVDLFRNNTPLTSIRRAMTNLTTQGFLRKTAEMKEGHYGKQCHTWRVNG